MNYSEDLWISLRRAKFPLCSGEHEKQLKIAFLQGMHSGRQLVIQSSTLSNNTMCEFNQALCQQIEAELRRLGSRPGNVKLSTTKPQIKVRARIEGQEI